MPTKLPASRSILTAIGLICFAMIGMALYLQHGLDMMPCPYCVIQRYAFLLTGLFALLAAWARPAKLWTALGLVTALGGLGFALRHTYILANPGFSCGINPMETFLNKIPTAHAAPWLFEAFGLCEHPDYWMGLQIPHWAALWFAVVAIALGYVLLRGRKAAA